MTLGTIEMAAPEPFSVQWVDRLTRGLDQLRRDEIDVVLLDLALPDGRGLEGLRRVCAEAPGAAVVVLTGHEDPETSRVVLRSGAQDCLVKGRLDSQTLSSTLRNSLVRKHLEMAIRESEERYALAVEGTNDGLWDWHVPADEIYFSPRWKEMLGYEEEELNGRPDEWFGRVHPDDIDKLRKEISAHLTGATNYFASEHRLRHRDGSYRWVLSRGRAVVDTSGAAYRMAGSLTDIHSRKATEQQLLHDAMHDALTDLPNWVLFMDRLGIAIAQARRYRNRTFGVLFVDLDSFKYINDTLGHTIGDRMLVAISQRLRALLRPGDTVARLGGDEFAVLVNVLEEPSDATRIAERIQEELQRPFELEGLKVSTSASIGIALGSTEYRRPEEVVRDADTAMYRAKSLGKARHAIFDEEMHRRAVEQIRLETELRRAVERQEFRLHYQPIVSLGSGALEGFEALIRWQHPSKGLIYPGAFLPVAEETGLIVPIGWRVLEEACRQVAGWHDRFPKDRHISMNVNLSRKQFAQGDLIGRIRDILTDTRVDPRVLRLEVSEGLITSNSESTVARLRQLKDLGVRLHIDDFGTGSASLSYLHRLPTDTIKIDRSFVSRVDAENGRVGIIRTIISLARSLGMEVTAEGLETASQLAKLRELECESGQGYYFAKPLTSRAADELIARHPHW
jgi:diguanylate cyclase (GGDEF)-like protein/PAS domain S-box-containing protein